MKKTLQIVGMLLASLLTIILVGCLLIQLPFIQTAVTSRVLDQLSGNLQGDIRIGHIGLRPFNTLVIRDLTILDKNPYLSEASDPLPVLDTFAHAGYVTAQFSLKGLTGKGGLHIDKAEVYDGGMNLVIEPDGQDNLSRIFGLQPNDKKPAEKDIFDINDVKVSGFRFRMLSHRKDFDETAIRGINWNDLDVRDINIIGQDMRMSHGITSGVAKSISMREKSGFEVKHLSGRVRVGKGKTLIEDLRFDDGDSQLYLNEYSMSYTCTKDFKDYLTKVTMSADIEEGKLDFKTISWFAPGLDGCRTCWDIKGKAHGTVEKLVADELSIRNIGDPFRATVSGTITGLPDVQHTHINARIRETRLTTRGLEDFINKWSPGGSLQLKAYAPGVTWFAHGAVRGLLNDFQAQLYLNSRLGKAHADARITNIIGTEGIGIEGKLVTEDLNVGRVIGSDIIGPCTLEADMDTRFGNGPKGTELHLNSLKVDRLHLNGYDYSNLIALGTLTAQSFNGKIICHDPSLNFLFQGTFAFSPRTKNALYSFYLNAGIVDLNKMNIDTRGKSSLQFQTMANFKKTNDGNLTGDINISDLVVENNRGKKRIGNIALSSLTKGKEYSIDLNSSFADARYEGNAPIYHFFSDLVASTVGQELPAFFTEPKTYRMGNRYKINVDFHDSMDLLSYAMPGLYIADSTQMKASIDEEGFFRMRLSSPRLAWNEHYVRKALMEMDNASGELSGELTSSEVRASTFFLKENRLSLKAAENHIGLGYTYNNEGTMTNRGEFYALANLFRTQADNLGIDVDIIPSKVYLNSREWSILPSKIHYADEAFKADKVEFLSGEQRLYVDGGYSRYTADTLAVNLERVDISILNPLIGMDLGLGGKATGSARLISPASDIGILVDMLCDETMMSNEPLGTLDAQCRWNEEFKRFDFNCFNDLDGKRNLDISGNYAPSANRLETRLDLDKLKVNYASVFLNSIFDELGGTVSGRITAEGAPDKLEIRSEDTTLDNAWLKIGFTNVGYKVNGRFDVDEYGVYFKDMDVRDRFNAPGVLNGSIYYDHFWDMGFDLRLKAHQIEALNLNEKQNENFYGNVFATGNIALKGPLTDMLLEIDAITSKSGNLHIPLNSTSEASATNLLTFKEPEQYIHIDPYEQMMERYKREKKQQTNFDVKMRVTATPDIEAFVEIQKETGNVLSGRGNGMITLDIQPNRDIFDLNGDYTLSSGKYHFVALGLASRDFTIKEGSTVHFNGDIMNTTLDIDANYRTKAALGTLIDDQNSVSSRRNIDCGIKITDQMMSPRLSFSIDVPDIDPMIKSKVDNALSTEDKVQKQFLSLIISNNFLPDERSGIVNNSSMLMSNVSEIMANQINNIFEKLNIPLDLGLNYQPNDKGTDIFDVALSTQLFNNRVIVNGSVGNKENKLGGTTNDVVGDLDIEIKLDKAGGWRANIFSHSADAYTNFLDNSQRNGIGLTWQQEFNSLGNYFKTLFMNKENRRIAKLEEENAMIDGGRRVLKITKENYEQEKKAKADIKKAKKAAREEKKALRAEKRRKKNDRKQR